MILDRKFRVPRVWSNNEIRRFGSKFKGKMINVSGWMDQDKEGHRYKTYFPGCTQYFVSNYESDACGFTGKLENEFYLDLEGEVPAEHEGAFDLVFNHTVLEHVFDVNKAFSNICKMSKDVVMIVVPFLQEQHAEYGDFWRFTPLAVQRLFEKNGFDLLYINFNDDKNNSIYVFAIGARRGHQWSSLSQEPGNKLSSSPKYMVRQKLIRNTIFYKVNKGIARLLGKNDNGDRC